MTHTNLYPMGFIAHAMLANNITIPESDEITRYLAEFPSETEAVNALHDALGDDLASICLGIGYTILFNIHHSGMPRGLDAYLSLLPARPSMVDPEGNAADTL